MLVYNGHGGAFTRARPHLFTSGGFYSLLIPCTVARFHAHRCFLCFYDVLTRTGCCGSSLPGKLTRWRSALCPPRQSVGCLSPGIQVQPVKAGEEIFSSFGSISNAQLLNSYGFVLPG